MASLLPHQYVDERPWGRFTQFTHDEISTVKIITVSSGEALSLQKHRERDEFWHVLSGEGFVTVGETELPAGTGDEFFIPRGTLHRIRGGSQPISVLEIAFGHFDENDIQRLEDKYGRF